MDDGNAVTVRAEAHIIKNAVGRDRSNAPDVAVFLSLQHLDGVAGIVASDGRAPAIRADAGLAVVLG
jgi:hypothetical protein